MTDLNKESFFMAQKQANTDRKYKADLGKIKF